MRNMTHHRTGMGKWFVLLSHFLILSISHSLILSIPQSLHAQEATDTTRVKLRGTVVDEKQEPIPMAIVRIEGQGIATTANIDGKYNIQFRTADSVVVVYQMIGFQKRTRVLKKPQGELVLNIVMKSTDRYIKLGFLTGVTKFSKVSVFSDLNNLDDISMQREYITACGLTEQEIHDYFDESVGELSVACGMTKEECYGELKERYDGYHFRENSVGVYNPFSVLNTLSKKEFDDYWFATATPTQLVKLLKSTSFNLYNIIDAPVSSDLLGRVDSMKETPLPVIYQSGYLTIKGYDHEFREYQLGFPNKEVESGFINYLLPLYTNARQPSSASPFSINQFVREVRSGRPEAFMTRLSAMMADTDYRIVGDTELYFQNFLFVFFRLLGLYVEVERATSDGRTDMIVQTKDYIYIFEFKLDRSADEALRQIDDKGYARPFAADGRPLYKIGVSFSSEKRRVEEYRIER